LDTVPEIPDDPAGVTYLQDAWATVDGWTSGTSIVSVNNGWLVFTNDAIEQPIGSKTISFSGGKTYRVKILCDLNDIIRFRATIASVSTIIFDATVVAGVQKIVDMYIPAGAVTDISWGSINNPAAPVGTKVQFDWIYIGTDAYLPNSLIDNSGNGVGITVKGSTPVAGTSGKALSRDGINDYEVTDAVVTMPDVFHYHEIWTVPNHATQLQVLLGIGTTSATGYCVFYRAANTQTLVLQYYNGATVISNTVANFFPATTLPVVADITINWLTGAVTVFKDGLSFATFTMVSAVKPSPVLWYFGNISTLASIYFAGGTVDERRCYNLAPSSKEVKYLFDNPGVPIPADATVIYYEDDAVLSTATASLEFTERYSGL